MINWGQLILTCEVNRVVIGSVWVIYCVCGIGLVAIGGLGTWREGESE